MLQCAHQKHLSVYSTMLQEGRESGKNGRGLSPQTCLNNLISQVCLAALASKVGRICAGFVFFAHACLMAPRFDWIWCCRFGALMSNCRGDMTWPIVLGLWQVELASLLAKHKTCPAACCVTGEASCGGRSARQAFTYNTCVY